MYVICKFSYNKVRLPDDDIVSSKHVWVLATRNQHTQ
jgi:hypothetical protein